MPVKNIISAIAIAALCLSCSTNKKFEQPNIIWLTCEDISPLLACYGDSTANTPNIDKLASESMIFTNAFATVGVCAPSRSSLITGMYPTSLGTMHMRTGRDYAGWGKRKYDAKSIAKDINGDSVPLYSAVVPEYVKCFTEYLRAAGYFCTNNHKTDYQFAAPRSAWDINSNTAHWQSAPDGKAFFAVFNHEVTHESRIWMNKNLPQTVSPATVPIPDYFPDNNIVRKDIARVYSNIELLDKQIGTKIKELKEAGLLDNTIIFFFSDHGGPLPRGKREHYDSGLRVPFLVRLPHGNNAGTYSELISFVDLAPTILSLAGIQPPEYIQGKAFMGKYKSPETRKYIYGSGDRFDEYTDRIRCVRDDQFMYVKNYYPELPRYKDVEYRKNIDMMNNLLSLNASHQLDSIESKWFEQTKPAEELYDCIADPYQLHNLATKPENYGKLIELRNKLKTWQNNYGDLGCIPEKELLEHMWPNGKQPITDSPVIIQKNTYIDISCNTKGASISYLVSDTKISPDLNNNWKLYTQPFKVQEGNYVYALSNRIGFADSEIIELEVQ